MLESGVSVSFTRFVDNLEVSVDALDTWYSEDQGRVSDLVWVCGIFGS